MLHQCRARANGLAGTDTVAGVVRRRGTPVGTRRLRQVLGAHRLITLEATGGDDHPAARLDVEPLTIAIDPCAAHPVTDQQQLFQRTVEPQRLAAILQRATQGADQGITQRQVAIAARQTPALTITPVTPHHPQGQAQPAGPATQQHLGFFHGHRHAPHHQGAGGRRAHAQEFFAQFGGIERLRVHGAIARLATLDFRVVIGVTRLCLETHPRLAFEVFDHLATMFDVSLDASVIDLAMGHRTDIGNRFSRRIAAAKRLDPMVVGDPDTTAGHRRGTAVFTTLLDQQRIETQVMGAQCSGHSPCSGANHQHITAFVPLDPGSVHAITLVQRPSGRIRRRQIFARCSRSRDCSPRTPGVHRPLGLRRR